MNFLNQVNWRNSFRTTRFRIVMTHVGLISNRFIASCDNLCPFNPWTHLSRAQNLCGPKQFEQHTQQISGKSKELGFASSWPMSDCCLTEFERLGAIYNFPTNEPIVKVFTFWKVKWSSNANPLHTSPHDHCLIDFKYLLNVFGQILPVGQWPHHSRVWTQNVQKLVWPPSFWTFSILSLGGCVQCVVAKMSILCWDSGCVAQTRLKPTRKQISSPCKIKHSVGTQRKGSQLPQGNFGLYCMVCR